jgi:hypothetical protein
MWGGNMGCGLPNVGVVAPNLCKILAPDSAESIPAHFFPVQEQLSYSSNTLPVVKVFQQLHLPLSDERLREETLH